ncbi:histidine kinase famiy protein [uncultured Caulobacter sp.]|uniref:histidine kinase famiy protein n=1 Tax=uncultured Caulobacter sp. TaxID=158749 RepID=UPI0026105373|nr:histidine kinase famiy protein [uncultured Caulobacter sp.]
MTPSDDDRPRQQPLEDVEGGGQSRGVPAAGTLDDGPSEPLGVPGRRHWRESTITRPDLNDRGGVFFAAVEMTRMPMILTDPNLPDNPVVFANKAFLDLTGYEEAEILGRNCRFLQGPGSDREVVAEIREAVEKVEAISVEILNYKRDGTPFWNAVFLGPVFDTKGELLYFFASQLDVSRRRNSEQAYRQSQKMEAIGQLTAGLAHDFNNLLQVVNGNLELLAARPLDERSLRYIDAARSAAERGAKLTRQLLAFARKTRLEPTPVNLSELIANFGELIESTLGATIDVQLNLRRRLPAVLVDADHFEMALLNIVINARDAMPDGGVVTITTKSVHLNGDAEARQLPSGDYVAVEVRDEGQGMPRHVLERAMEPFFTTKGVGKGTGLGLAMAHGFVQQSRGRLEIESEVGQGALIRMIFPAAADAVARPVRGPTASPAIAAPVEAPSPGAARILLVEDNPEVQALAREILTAEGYGVTLAASGDEGFTTFAAAPDQFDLLFSDIVMPGGRNGIVLAEDVRRLRPDLPVLLTTGYNEDLLVEGPARPSLDVIGKPYRRAELLDRVRQALGQSPGGVRRTPSDFGSAEA